MKHVQKIAFPCLFRYGTAGLTTWSGDFSVESRIELISMYFMKKSSNIDKVDIYSWAYISVNEVNIFGINEVNGVDIYRNYAMQGSWSG